MKRIIFVLSIIAYLQDDTLLATNIANNIQNVKDFLDSTDIGEKDKKFIIAHFNHPNAGIPVWIKNQPKSKKTRISKFTKLLNLALQKPSQPYPPKLKIDELGTAIASKLRQHVKISPDVHIPIFTKNFKLSLLEKNLDTSLFWYDYSDVAYKLRYPFITLDLLINKLLHHTIPFRLAHEYAHLEIGHSIERKKICVGIINGLLSYIFLSHKKCNKLTSLIGSIGSYILSAFLCRGYFQRQEEKACDLRAIELTNSYKGIEEFFSHKLEIYVIFSNNDWIIAEITLIFDKPQEYTTWKEQLFSLHPSDAERIRYCKAFAQERGYI